MGISECPLQERWPAIEATLPNRPALTDLSLVWTPGRNGEFFPTARRGRKRVGTFRAGIRGNTERRGAHGGADPRDKNSQNGIYPLLLVQIGGLCAVQRVDGGSWIHALLEAVESP